MPRNWKSRKSDEGTQELFIVCFTRIPTALIALSRNLASKLFCFYSVCKSFWHTSQTDSANSGWISCSSSGISGISMFIQRGVSVHVIQWRRIQRLFFSPQWSVTVRYLKADYEERNNMFILMTQSFSWYTVKLWDWYTFKQFNTVVL